MLGPAGGGREPRRRRRLGRLGGGAARARRRLHAARQLVGARRQPGDLRQAALRHAEGLRQHRAARRRAERAHRRRRAPAGRRSTDFIAAAKAKPGQAQLLLRRRRQRHALQPREAQADGRHRRACTSPYKGTPEAIGDTIAGRVCCYWAPINAALPHVNGGKAVALGGVERAALAACCRTCRRVAEQGVPGFDYTLWVGLWGPADMPADLVGQDQRRRERGARQPGPRRSPDQARHRAGEHDDRRVHRSSCARKSRTPRRSSRPPGSSRNEEDHFLALARGLRPCMPMRRAIRTSRCT